jgi:hypothetical protein
MHLTLDNFTRINNDVNGNPRFVCHFLNLLTDKDEKEAKRRTASYGLTSDYKPGNLINFQYEIALEKARKIGGKKFHNKQYGGGIVFQSASVQSICDKINNLLNS